MDMEELEEKRPRFLWIIVVAVVAAALAVFILIQSGRMKSQVADVAPGESGMEEMASDSGWPSPQTALSEERVPQAEDVSGMTETAEPAPVVEKSGETAVASRPQAVMPERAAPSAAPKTEAKPARTESATKTVPTSDAGRFVVQVGSFKDDRIARIQADKLEKYGYRAWVESADVAGKGRFYRVRVGGFDDITDAREVAESLSEKLGTSCWVANR